MRTTTLRQWGKCWANAKAFCKSLAMAKPEVKGMWLIEVNVNRHYVHLSFQWHLLSVIICSDPLTLQCRSPTQQKQGVGDYEPALLHDPEWLENMARLRAGQRLTAWFELEQWHHQQASKICGAPPGHELLPPSQTPAARPWTGTGTASWCTSASHDQDHHIWACPCRSDTCGSLCHSDMPHTHHTCRKKKPHL